MIAYFGPRDNASALLAPAGYFCFQHFQDMAIGHDPVGILFRQAIKDRIDADLANPVAVLNPCTINHLRSTKRQILEHALWWIVTGVACKFLALAQKVLDVLFVRFVNLFPIEFFLSHGVSSRRAKSRKWTRSIIR